MSDNLIADLITGVHDRVFPGARARRMQSQQQAEGPLLRPTPARASVPGTDTGSALPAAKEPDPSS